ncbi:MAG: hypothetical protein CBC94_000485 [Gammaproteobacteria bacterium TMED134]|nr:MAG: hypothetical protein CBC94_000485 [Gammaproteobacteria bacterium TMED134]
MKNIGLLLLTLAAMPLAALGAGLEINEGTLIEANFNIDSLHTKDGQTYELSASGDGGPYGRVYLSYVMTNLQSVDGYGEFTGYAWAQSGEDVVTATLQGISKKEGALYKMYTLDLVNNGVMNFAIGTVDMVAGTMTFKVGEFD